MLGMSRQQTSRMFRVHNDTKRGGTIRLPTVYNVFSTPRSTLGVIFYGRNLSIVLLD